VWLGYDDSRSTKDTSVVATYAWRAFMAPISKDLPVRQFPPKPQLADTYKPEKQQPKRRSESAATSESWREQAPQPQDLDPTPSVYERPEALDSPAAPQVQKPSTPAPTVSPAATSPAPVPPPPVEAPPPPVVAPPPP
jgi:penicillin-binding protein 1A